MQAGNSNKITELTTPYIDELAAATAGINRKLIQMCPAGSVGRSATVSIPGMTLIRDRWHGVVHSTLTPPKNSIAFCIPLDRGDAGKWNSRTIRHRDIVVLCRGVQHRMIVSSADFVTLVCEESALGSLGKSVRELGSLIVSDKQANKRVRRQIWRVLRDSCANTVCPSNRTNPDTKEALRLGLVEVLRAGINRMGEFRRQSSRVAWATACRAQDFINEKLVERITVGEISAAAGVSNRTLEYSFKNSFGVTPKSYLRLARLNEARRRLRQNVQSSVTVIATDCGYSHMSHFSAQYREMFGELPSDTLKRRAAGRPRDAVRSSYLQQVARLPGRNLAASPA